MRALFLVFALHGCAIPTTTDTPVSTVQTVVAQDGYVRWQDAGDLNTMYLEGKMTLTFHDNWLEVTKGDDTFVIPREHVLVAGTGKFN